MSIADGIRKWFWQGAASLLDTVSAQGEHAAQELAELKKLLRRQGIQQETLLRDLVRKIDALPAAEPDSVETNTPPPDSLTELAESFFHLAGVLPLSEGGAEVREAIGMVWAKLDGACLERGLSMVREAGVPFDSRIHEALDRAPDGESPGVAGVTAPGFVLNGRVLKPARVTLSERIPTSGKREGE